MRATLTRRLCRVEAKPGRCLLRRREWGRKGREDGGSGVIACQGTMKHTAVTVIARLKPSADLPTLAQYLLAMGQTLSADGDGTIQAKLSEVSGLHFLRLLIIKDPDRGPERARLLLAAVIDGDENDESATDRFLAELGDALPDLDKIWGGCEGYVGRDGFVAFMSSNLIRPAAFYVAFKEENVESLRRYDALRRRWDELRFPQGRHSPEGPPPWSGRPFSVLRYWRRFCRWVARPVTLVPQLAATFADGRRMIRAYGFRPTWAGATTIVRGLNRYPGWRFFNLMTCNFERQARPRLSQVPVDRTNPPFDRNEQCGFLEAGSHLPGVEDRLEQNQLTLITPIANRQRLNQLGAVLGAVDSYARIWSRPGNLLGMSTIHFVRWMPIDDGRRLLMLSDYDHSWEAYIDEFIEMIRTGMDAIWSSAAKTGVPAYKTGPTELYQDNYLWHGSGDASTFKHFLRAHQANAHLFYSAQASRTVLHTKEDRQLFRNVSLTMSDHEFRTRVLENAANEEI
ncbi:MAG: hypothetical protein ISQ14_01730 [Verrucomicrobiae bacterium]|nr:hypothetical protein [Verrucomicrobiae bacterium]